jgi:hypothetical protein
MKHITPISKKNRYRQILTLCICLCALTSCYEFESLPDKIKSDYSFAIPLIDTTVRLGDFAYFLYHDIPGINIPEVNIPEGTPIRMGELAYPFYIGDYSSSQEIARLEPQLIIDTEDLPSGTEINLKIYTKDDFENRVYFWLPDDYSISLVNTPVKVPEDTQRITNIEKFRSARKVFLDITITYPTAVSSTQILNDRINIKFAIKFSLTTDLKINL